MKSLNFPARALLVCGISSLILALPNSARADTPLGWISSGNPSAYTIDRFSFELSGAKLLVNDTIDFLNIRQDLLAGQQKLVGNSGDLDGERLEFHVGLTEDLALFYTRQQQDLTVNLGTISSVNLVDISKSLETQMESVGLKWIFWRGNLLNADNRFSAAALEVSGFANKTKDFDVTVSDIYYSNFTISFRDNATFSVADLQDDGWKARMIYTWPFPVFADATATVWAGYGESNATSATTSNITSQTIKNFFEQQFEVAEEYYYLGASLNWNLTPRLPLTVNYEYIRINASDFSRNPDPPRSGLPGFLTQSPASLSGNHTVSGSLAYWLTPSINLSLTGNLYSNQFLGILAHYSNPLSGSFVDKPYGFIGLRLGFNF